MEKGEYTAHVQVRQPDTSQLELLMDTPLQYVICIVLVARMDKHCFSVRVHISPAISLDVTSMPNAGDNGGLKGF